MEKLRPDDPEQLGPYKIIARLGSGGMGVVFLGSQGSRRVAVKVVRSSFLDNPSLRTRFEREIETLKKLKSKHVAAYLDSDVDGELAWHAVEFVNGPTLREQIEHQGPMSTDEWWAFYENLKTALSDIHALGITHRDLKPSNIILSETGIKLIDFGIAQDTEATSITTTGTVTGSPAWLSPEHLEGTELGPASDLFSAGSILVYAALGRSPWGSETTMTVPVAFQRILTLDLRLDGLKPDFESAVRALLISEESSRSFELSAGRNYGPETTGTSAPKPVPTEAPFPKNQETKLPKKNVSARPAKEGGARAVIVLFSALALGVAAVIAATNVHQPARWSPTPSEDERPAAIESTETKQVVPNPASLAADCKVFSCAFAVDFSPVGADTLVSIWSRDMSVTDATEVSLGLRKGSLSEGFANIGNCRTDSADPMIAMNPAGYWLSDEGNGVVWTLLCKNGTTVSEFVLLEAVLPNGDVLRQRFRPDAANDITFSDWGADPAVLENIQEFPPIDSAELDFSGMEYLDGMRFVLRVPRPQADAIEQVSSRIYDRQNESVVFTAANSWEEACGEVFELESRAASSEEHYFVRNCGPPELGDGWVELEILLNDGTTSTHRLGF